MAVDPRTDTRFALQVLQRLGSLVNCLSWKNICSPDVNKKSTPQSEHFNILSRNSIEDAPWPFPARIRPPVEKIVHLSRRTCAQDFRFIPLRDYCPLDSARHALGWTWITSAASQLRSPR
jgi:hypothetical protein